MSLDESKKIDHPEVLKAIEMLKEGNKKQLEVYNHLVEAVPAMTDSEVKEVMKAVPKPDIGVLHSILEVFDKYGEQNFRCIVTVGQYLFEQFMSNTTGEKARSLLKIYSNLNISRKKVHEILNGECYKGGSAVAKQKSLTPQKQSAAKVAKQHQHQVQVTSRQ